MLILLIISSTCSHGQNTLECKIETGLDTIEIRCSKIYYPNQFELLIKLSEFTKGASRLSFRQKNRQLRKFIKSHDIDVLSTEARKYKYMKGFCNIPYTRSIRLKEYEIRLDNDLTLVKLLDLLIAFEVQNVSFNHIGYPSEAEIINDLTDEIEEEAKATIASKYEFCELKDVTIVFTGEQPTNMPPKETYYFNGFGRKDSLNAYIYGLKGGIGLAKAEDVYAKP